MNTVTLGRSDAGPLRLDVPALIEGGAFVTASSGQGKSWLLRLLIERIIGQVQVVIIDPEGEFSSLREKYPMLLVGVGGEVEATTRSAKLLARKLAELKLSAVIDLYDIGDWDDRRAYVAEFLTGLMNVPKALYHPIIIPIDEAHMFAPKAEGGTRGDDPAGRARRAVITLSSAGRKRGFRAVLASQRISKIHNDAIADLRTRFIGGITLDNDQARAADELGISKAERVGLRDLEPGEFYAYGPAIVQRGVTRFRTDPVTTTHPHTGEQHLSAPPPTPAAIQKLAQALADLPHEAQAEADELVAARHQVGELQRQLRARPVQVQLAAPETIVERVEVTVFRDGEVGRLESAIAGLTAAAGTIAGAGQQLVSTGEQFRAAAAEVSGALKAAAARVNVPIKTGPIGPVPAPRTAAPTPVRAITQPATATEGRKLAKAERSILTVLAQRGPRTKRQVAVQAGYAVKGGGFNNAVSALSAAGHIIRSGETVEITESGAAALGTWEPLPTGRALLAYWAGQLPKAERLILEALAVHRPDGLTKEQVAAETGYEAGGGGFNNAVSRLRTLELIFGTRVLKASEELFGDLDP